jgi:hypothetical protein
MKRYLIFGAVVGCFAIFLLLWRSHQGSGPNQQESTAEAPTTTIQPESQRDATNQPAEARAEHTDSLPVVTNQIDERSEQVQWFEKYPDVPVSFYGLVVDQDSNALQNVKVDVAITQWDTSAPPGSALKTPHVESHTGLDGRFQVDGVNGHSLTVVGFTKDGYEPEFIRRQYGEYGSHGGSIGEPIVFRLWSTNLHQPLITAEKSFVIIPDGRNYAIDLEKGTIAEGDSGDLVAWIKRPEKVKWGERYDWSCQLAIPGGGLLESQNQAMFMAPEAGYTNAFAYQEDADLSGGGPMTGDKRFYVRLRNGQMYGRITVDLYADYHGKQPALIRLSYAVNPSGSRLLR